VIYPLWKRLAEVEQTLYFPIEDKINCIIIVDLASTTVSSAFVQSQVHMFNSHKIITSESLERIPPTHHVEVQYSHKAFRTRTANYSRFSAQCHGQSEL